MSAGEPLSRSTIAAMSDDEFERREGEVHRWLAAGGKDGEPAPPDATVRPAGHRFTVDEVQAMTPAEIEANWSALRVQLPTLGADRNRGARNRSSKS